MTRPNAIPGLLLSVFGLACGGTSSSSPGESEAPSAPPTAAEQAEPEGPPPPMYKPSSRSKAPMAITDPAYGAYGDAPGAPGMGAKLPDFEVALADGGSFSLAQARKAGPVLVMFYRGFW
ncbi:MAG: hypothetical protein AAF799_10940 [Myxococcota bacterium]